MKMKKKVQIKTVDGKTIFTGKVLDLPIKKQRIIDKSIEIFDDDDPCIIHKSYVIKLYAKELLDLIPDGSTELRLSEIKDKIDFLDVESIDECILIVEG